MNNIMIPVSEQSIEDLRFIDEAMLMVSPISSAFLPFSSQLTLIMMETGRRSTRS